MGVGCRILLPGNVRIRDVCSVIAVAVGFEPSVEPLTKTGVSTRVKGVTAKASTDTMPDFLTVQFDNRHCYFSYEPTDVNPGGRTLNPKSTAFWCLVGQRLVDVFGGKVDYNDCDDIAFDYVKRNRSNAMNCPNDGDEWNALQYRIANVPPITEQEFRAFKGAAYDFDSDGYEYTFDEQGHMKRGPWAMPAVVEKINVAVD